MRILIISLWFVITAVDLSAQTYIYRNKAEDNKMATTTTIDTLENGFLMQVVRHSEAIAIIEVLETGPDFDILSWKLNNPNINSNFEAKRKGNKIILKGVHRGKQVLKEFKIDKNSWRQVFPHDLSTFVRSGKRKCYFWAIGTSGPGDMKVAKFKAIVKAKEILELDMGSQEAVKVHISLTGLLAMFWQGNYWLRVSDGRYLQFKGKVGGSGSGETITQLTEERAIAD